MEDVNSGHGSGSGSGYGSGYGYGDGSGDGSGSGSGSGDGDAQFFCFFEIEKHVYDQIELLKIARFLRGEDK